MEFSAKPTFTYVSPSKTDANVKTRREKEGRCGECGIKTHEVKKALFRVISKTPITIPNEVHRGRCLLCKPLSFSDDCEADAAADEKLSAAISDDAAADEKPLGIPDPHVSMTIVGSKHPPIKQQDREKGTEMVSYVMANGTQYGVKLINHGQVKVQAILSVDGNKVGTFVLEPSVEYTVERPVSVAKKFTFYTVRAVRAAQASVQSASANPQDQTKWPTAGEVAVAQCGIQRGSEVDDHLNGQIKCVITPVKAVFVALPNGDMCAVPFDPEDSVANVKASIFSKTGFKPREQIITLHGRELKDSRTLSSYSIEKKSVILRMDIPKGSFRINVHTENQCLLIGVHPSETVDDLKHKIKDRTWCFGC